jgi:hypothetical protein
MEIHNLAFYLQLLLIFIKLNQDYQFFYQILLKNYKLELNNFNQNINIILLFVNDL